MDAEEGGPFQCRPGVHSIADPGVPKNADGGSLTLPVSTGSSSTGPAGTVAKAAGERTNVRAGCRRNRRGRRGGRREGRAASGTGLGSPAAGGRSLLAAALGPHLPQILQAVLRRRFRLTLVQCVGHRLQPDADSHAGAQGLMQIMPATWGDIARHLSVTDPMYPRHSIAAGIYYDRGVVRPVADRQSPATHGHDARQLQRRDRPNHAGSGSLRSIAATLARGSGARSGRESRLCVPERPSCRPRALRSRMTDRLSPASGCQILSRSKPCFVGVQAS